MKYLLGAAVENVEAGRNPMLGGYVRLVFQGIPLLSRFR